MDRGKIDKLLKKAQAYQELAEPALNEPSDVFYRAQPIGTSLFNHISGLADKKVPGIFAFTDPEKIFDTYSWLHMKKNPDKYEMITFKGKLVESPEDSEGVVVKPEQIIDKAPLKEWAKRYLLVQASRAQMAQSGKRWINR